MVGPVLISFGCIRQFVFKMAVSGRYILTCIQLVSVYRPGLGIPEVTPKVETVQLNHVAFPCGSADILQSVIFWSEQINPFKNKTTTDTFQPSMACHEKSGGGITTTWTIKNY